MQSVDCPYFPKLSRGMIGIISKKVAGRRKPGPRRGLEGELRYAERRVYGQQQETLAPVQLSFGEGGEGDRKSVV